MKLIYNTSNTHFHLSLPPTIYWVEFKQENTDNHTVNTLVEYNPRIHVVELAPMGYRYYKGAFSSFEQVPPRYTWRQIDYRSDGTIVYVDLTNEPSFSRMNN